MKHLFTFHNPNAAQLKVLHSYDVLAFRTSNGAIFEKLCEKVEADVLSLDLSKKLNFFVNKVQVKQAFARGIYFELEYSGAFESKAARKSFL